MQIFFIALGKIIRNFSNIQIYEEIYKLSSMSIIKVLYHLPRHTKVTELPTWFSAI